MKTLVKLVIAGLIVNASWKSGMVFWHYYKFKDGVQATAQFAGARTETEIHNRVIEIARELDIPVDPEKVAVRKEENHTFVDADYMENIELVPTYTYPWHFKVNIDVFTIAMPSSGDFAPTR